MQQSIQYRSYCDTVWFYKSYENIEMDAPTDLSYLHTSIINHYNYTTVTKVARENARLRPNQEIFIFRELDGSRSSLTNASLYQQAEQLAKYLLTQGIRKGDIVALAGPNTLEMVIGTLGILAAGAVVWNVVINMKTALDVKALFQQTRAKCILVDCGKDGGFLLPFKTMLENCSAGDAYNIQVISLREADSHQIKAVDTLQNIQTRQLKEVDLPDIYPEDNAIIFTTSGSTGKPKMVLHSHFDFASNPFSFTPPTVDYDVILFNERPFAWIGGTPVLGILRSQSRVFMDSTVAINSKNADFVWRTLKEERCTDALLLPFVIHDLLELPKSVTEDGFKLQHINTGGQMINDNYTGVIGQFCHKMMITYASTEATCIASKGPFDDEEPLQAGDVGKPSTGMEIRVVDLQGLPINKGSIGKIQIRSQQIMRSYVGSPQLTKEAFTEDRWFRTGDIGKVSPDGNLILLGREIDVISRGTRKIYPGMLEFLLKQMKMIKEVCVVPVPDERLYEEVCVCFVSSGELTPDDVQQYCKQNLFKENTIDSLGEMPTYFLKFEAFPKLGAGKTDKKAIRLDASIKLGLTEHSVDNSQIN
ncbi:oxalate--CoA ligase-like [Pecten maximus]|uniref:oxalate--CoA ligase-like n=1 Tax=Pecten maximus TaxID=6579 RepID=UPI001458AEE9|nr:oxalate--CoA ligase-like [Pecten maximus]